MKIAASALQMDAQHAREQRHEIHESIRSFRRRPELSSGVPENSSRPASKVQISDAGKAAQSGAADAIQAGKDIAENDPMLRLLRAMVAMLTGREVNITRCAACPAAQQAQTETGSSAPALPEGFAVEEYQRYETYAESEATQFSARGVVQTSDGQQIEFSLSLAMMRSYYEETSTTIRQVVQRQKQDPLVLNFDGTAAQLTRQRFSFDLNADGKADEEINFATGGSGFLAFDRNGDGRINNGTELFGVASGNGFADLARLDDDGNGWIDENDSAWERLRVWQKTEAGEDRLTTLREANVGALNLASVVTPFDLKNDAQELLGQIRSSGVFLAENGRAGTIQQVDLTV